ncbi:MAG: reductase [Micromonosporaceae bacterium]|nr:reductase [Micromonosporaceae bacterium]
MRLLVFGGSVFLSRTVAQQALQRGYDVTCASRGVSGSPPEGARHVTLDRDDPDAMASLRGERFDAVIDVARRPSQVRHALRALSDRVGHWTFVSTGSVYADTATPGQRVDSAPLLPPAPPDADESDIGLYGQLKVSCEQVVAAARGDDAFVVRAGLIGGPHDVGDRFSYWPLRLARGGEVLAPGAPEDDVQVIDVRDLSAWLLDGAAQRLTGTYDGVGEVTPFGRLLERVAAGVGAHSHLTWVDQEFLVGHKVEPYMGERSLPMWLPLPEYAGWSSRDASSAYAAGLRCRDLAETARDTLAWERDSGREHPVNAGLTEAEEAELLAAWHERQGEPGS